MSRSPLEYPRHMLDEDVAVNKIPILIAQLVEVLRREESPH